MGDVEGLSDHFGLGGLQSDRAAGERIAQLEAELQAAQERERVLREAIDRMLSEIGEPNADYAAPLAEAYWIGQEALNGPQARPAQRTEEPGE